jgi:hypothetical protein
VVQRGLPQGSFALVKEASMAMSYGLVEWHPLEHQFFHLVQDWEVDILASFYSLLYSLRGRRVAGGKAWLDLIVQRDF